MPLSDEQVRSLLLACRETEPTEIDCEAFLTLMAQYVEARAEGHALPPALAGAAAHERLCANCREESRALLEIISSARRDA